MSWSGLVWLKWVGGVHGGKKAVVWTASIGRSGAARRARATHLGGEAQAGPTTCEGGGRPSL
jgi:hypothetical protein